MTLSRQKYFFLPLISPLIALCFWCAGNQAPAAPQESKSKAIELDLVPDASETPGRHSRKGGHQGRRNKGERRHHGDIPSFRNVKRLESLTPVQSSKINKILREYKEVMSPLSSKIRASREANLGGDADSGRARGDRELRQQMHRLKRETWQKMQKILTPAQKSELARMRSDDRGPKLRNNPDAQPSMKDSGKSFSK
ncbi:MAG TPA: Spy/CpxP family protein refolding chaperone [Candidatus Melainabacteria bacterium]|nr:Spy/CpxP family protein refolding chaperone [Candidatus Melainabacteria bacterium]